MRLPPDGGALTIEGVAALRATLVAAQFNFFPEITGQKRSIAAIGSWVGKCGSFDPAADYRNEFGSLLNTALYLDGLVAFDLDIDDASSAEIVLARATTLCGPPVSLRYRANSPRAAILYQTSDTPLAASLKGVDGAIEVLTGAHMKLTSFGLHTDKHTGVRTRLCWDAVPGNVARADLPLITQAMITAFLTDPAVQDCLGEDSVLKQHSGREPAQPAMLRPSDPADAFRALAYIPNAGPLHWDDWNRVGMALWSATAGSDEGNLAFRAWTNQNPHTRHRNAAAKWDAYALSPPTHIGIGTLMHMARQHGLVISASQFADQKLRRILSERKAVKQYQAQQLAEQLARRTKKT